MIFPAIDPSFGATKPAMELLTPLGVKTLSARHGGGGLQWEPEIGSFGFEMHQFGRKRPKLFEHV
jgi:hypothetical protein